MTWDATRATLDAKFLTLAGLDTAKVAWPGQAFTPTPGSIWYSIALLPAGTDAALGPTGSKHETGIYQVSIYGPPGSGSGDLFRAADAVVALFDRTLGSGVQCGVPTPGPLLTEPDWLHLPVSIPFWVL